MNISRDTHHVVPNSDRGGWDIKRGGADRASAYVDTKAQAINIAREISRNQGTEMVVHEKNGRIQSSDSHGHDPCPPKDMK